MLAMAELDGALITSPNNTHLDNLREFEGHSIPILLEKPLDTQMESVAEIVRFAARYRGSIVVDHVMRYAPIIQRAREIIRSGRLGKLASFQFTQRIGSDPFNTFRRTYSGGGGQIIEKATHDLDIILYLFDALPERVAISRGSR
jgi:predicted dehydrogenase